MTELKGNFLVNSTYLEKLNRNEIDREFFSPFPLHANMDNFYSVSSTFFTQHFS